MKHTALLIATLSSFLAWTPALPAHEPSDWPAFRGPTGQGTSNDSMTPTRWTAQDNVVWKTELPGAGTSSPIILGGRVFLTSYSGYGVPGQAKGTLDDLKLHVLCLDRSTGKQLWQKDLNATGGEQPTIREGHGYASGTPATDRERLYVSFGKSGVYAFDLEGNQFWRAEIGEGINGWGSSASPVLFDNLVIVNASVESQALIALDKKTGKEVWRAPGIKESWNTPVLATVDGGRQELVLAIMGKILGFDPRTGKQLWSCATDIGWYMVPSLVVHDGVVYCIGGRSGGALAVRAGGQGDVTSTHRLWTGRKGSNVSSPVYHDGHLYWMNDNQGIAYCAEAKTGKIVYEENVDRGRQVYASAVLANGKLYYVSRTGRTYVLPARPTYELLATNELGDRSTFNASPAVAGGRLYLRSDRYLYCIGEK